MASHRMAHASRPASSIIEKCLGWNPSKETALLSGLAMLAALICCGVSRGRASRSAGGQNKPSMNSSSASVFHRPWQRLHSARRRLPGATVYCPCTLTPWGTH
eukprot:2817641-Karenia_brevis.AAC.1